MDYGKIFTAVPDFFFVKDYKRDFRFFSSEPPRPPDLKRSKLKEGWELAKKKLMLLPQKKLRQELGFARALRIHEPVVRIYYSGLAEEKKINLRFILWLNKCRTSRIAVLIGEALLLPITGLLVPIPGPNVAFYALALLIITHWQSFRGVHALLKKRHEFIETPVLAEWEEAVKARSETAYPDILARLEAEFGLAGLRKVLWK
jgi:hypothetical protein